MHRKWAGARNAEPVTQHDQRDGRRPEAPWNVLDGERPDERDGAAQREAVQESDREELLVVRDERQPDGERAKHRRTQNDRGPPPDPIADEAEQKAADQGAGDAAAEHVTHHGVREPEPIDQVGRGEGDDVLVEAVKEGDEPRHQHHADDEAAWFVPLDDFADVDDGRRGCCGQARFSSTVVRRMSRR